MTEAILLHNDYFYFWYFKYILLIIPLYYFLSTDLLTFA